MNRPISTFGHLLDNRNRLITPLGALARNESWNLDVTRVFTPEELHQEVSVFARRAFEASREIDGMRFREIEACLLGWSDVWIAEWNSTQAVMRLQERDGADLVIWLHMAEDMGLVKASFIGRQTEGHPQAGIWAFYNPNSWSAGQSVRLGYSTQNVVEEQEDSMRYCLSGAFSYLSRLTYEIPLRHPAK